MDRMVRFTPILFVILVLFIALPVGAGNGSRDDALGDVMRMQGKWELVDFVYYEDSVAERFHEEDRSGVRVVTGTTYRLKLILDGRLAADDNYTFKLYPNRNPKAFDVTMPDGRTVVKGIYEINGDTLRRCYTRPNEARPERFETGTQTYQQWQRVIDPDS